MSHYKFTLSPIGKDTQLYVATPLETVHCKVYVSSMSGGVGNGITFAPLLPFSSVPKYKLFPVEYNRVVVG